MLCEKLYKSIFVCLKRKKIQIQKQIVIFKIILSCDLDICVFYREIKKGNEFRLTY